jgi:hypothetical protein
VPTQNGKKLGSPGGPPVPRAAKLELMAKTTPTRPRITAVPPFGG